MNWIDEVSVKLRLAQRKILDCHAFAKEIENKEDIATSRATKTGIYRKDNILE